MSKRAEAAWVVLGFTAFALAATYPVIRAPGHTVAGRPRRSIADGMDACVGCRSAASRSAGRLGRAELLSVSPHAAVFRSPAGHRALHGALPMADAQRGVRLQRRVHRVVRAGGMRDVPARARIDGTQGRCAGRGRHLRGAAVSRVASRPLAMADDRLAADLPLGAASLFPDHRVTEEGRHRASARVDAYRLCAVLRACRPRPRRTSPISRSCQSRLCARANGGGRGRRQRR